VPKVPQQKMDLTHLNTLTDFLKTELRFYYAVHFVRY